MAEELTFPQATDPEGGENYDSELAKTIPNGTIISYNLDDGKAPGGLKVRFKIRVVSGAEADRWDARQAEAIKELLLWASRHPPRR